MIKQVRLQFLSAFEGAGKGHIIGVFKLDVSTFEEIEHDESATSQAALVVDDGLASGYTMRAALQFLRRQGAGRLISAVRFCSILPGSSRNMRAISRRLSEESSMP